MIFCARNKFLTFIIILIVLDVVRSFIDSGANQFLNGKTSEGKSNKLKRHGVQLDGPYMIELAIFVHVTTGKYYDKYYDIIAMIDLANRILKEPSLGMNISVNIVRFQYFDANEHYIPISSWDVPYVLKRFNTFLKKLRKKEGIKDSDAWDLAVLLSPLGAYHDPGFGTNIVEEQQIFTCRQNLKERGIMGYNLKSLEYFQWSECSSLYIRYNLRKNGGCLKKSISKTNLYKIDSTYYHYIYAYVPDQYCHSYYGKNYRADYNMSNCHKMRCRKEAWKTDKFIPSPDYSFCHKDTLASLPTGFVCKSGKCLQILIASRINFLVSFCFQIIPTNSIIVVNSLGL
ncbi:unnamed protein product [Gordionus sp. m RMFG-2023]